MGLHHGVRDGLGFDLCQSAVLSAAAVELTENIIWTVEYDMAELMSENCKPRTPVMAI